MKKIKKRYLKLYIYLYSFLLKQHETLYFQNIKFKHFEVNRFKILKRHRTFCSKGNKFALSQYRRRDYFELIHKNCLQRPLKG